jgi:hypothetical protein
MKTFEISPAQDLLPMELPLMSLQAVSRAKTLALQERSVVLEKELGLVSGLKSLELLAKYDRDTSSWRTSQICFLAQVNGQAGGLAEYWETWPRSGLMRNGIAYRLPLSRLHILATGCGYWPTPNKSNGFAPFSMLTIRRKASGLSRPSGCKMGFDLKWEPRAVPYLVDGWINPILTEWLMGFSIGHTDLQRAETP